jgi:exodeoxyribonuclease VII large subunit
VRHRLAIARSSYVFQRPAEVVRGRRQQSDELRMRLEHAMAGALRVWRLRMDKGAHSLALLSPENGVRRAVDRLQALRARLAQSGGGLGERYRSRLRPAAGRLEALSPVAILSRGYSIAWKLPENALVREAGQLSRGDDILVMFGKGRAVAAVQRIEEETDGGIQV